jgi:hypothetical protein
MSKRGNSEPEAREPAVESTHTTQHVSHNQASARAPTCLGARQSGPCLLSAYSAQLRRNRHTRHGRPDAAPGPARGPETTLRHHVRHATRVDRANHGTIQIDRRWREREVNPRFTCAHRNTQAYYLPPVSSRPVSPRPCNSTTAGFQRRGSLEPAFRNSPRPTKSSGPRVAATPSPSNRALTSKSRLLIDESSMLLDSAVKSASVS